MLRLLGKYYGISRWRILGAFKHCNQQLSPNSIIRVHSTEVSISIKDGKFDNSGERPLKVPGYNGPCIDGYNGLDERFSANWYGGHDQGNRHHSWIQEPPVTAREIAMLQIMSDVTEKPDWHLKICEPDTAAQWEQEMLSRPLMSKASWEWILLEMQDKAAEYHRTGHLRLLDSGACVYKSDKTIPRDLQQELRQAAKSLLSSIEQCTGDSQRRHLIDPSMYMLSFETTPVLVDGGSISLDNIFDFRGKGKIGPPLRRFDSEDQWLPCEVRFSDETSPGIPAVQITSYVNNLPPIRHRDVYGTLEKLISHAIEPWNKILMKWKKRDDWRDLLQYPGRVPQRMRTFGAKFDPPPPTALYRQLPIEMQWDQSFDDDTLVLNPPDYDDDWADIDSHPDLPCDSSEMEFEPSAEDLPSAKALRHKLRDVNDLSVELLARIEEYLSLPENGSACTKPNPDWRDNILRSIVDKSRRICRLQHPEPGTAYSYQDWKAGRTSKAIISPRPAPVWKRVPRPAPGGVDHQYYSVDLEEAFRERGLQVVIEMASFELSPDKPSLAESEWRIDGRGHDGVAATAIYFYDVCNVTSSALSLRQFTGLSELWYPYSFPEYGILIELLGLENEWPIRNPPSPRAYAEINAPAAQTMGSVASSDGRLVAWPNTIQYRWEGMELDDRSRSGHCRYVKISLVDPHLRVCSTRNVSPQQESWWRDVSEESFDDGIMTFEVAKEVKAVRESDLARRYDLEDPCLGRISIMLER